MKASVVGAGIGFGAAVLVWALGYLGSAIRWLLNSPAIAVSFTPDEGCVTETEAGEGDKKTVLKYGRIRVRNEPHFLFRWLRSVFRSYTQPLLGCRVWLLEIEEQTKGGGWQKTIFQDSFQLIWSYKAEIDDAVIPREVVWYADVVTFGKLNGTGPMLFLPCLRGQHGETLYPNRFLKLYALPGKYRLHLLVTADNAEAKRITVPLTMSGDGKVGMFYVDE